MLSSSLENGLALVPARVLVMPLVVRLGTAPTIQAVPWVVLSRVRLLFNLTLSHGPRMPMNPLVIGPSLAPPLGRWVVMTTRLTLGTT